MSSLEKDESVPKKSSEQTGSIAIICAPSSKSPVKPAPLLPVPTSTSPDLPEDNELLEPNRHGFLLKLFHMIEEVNQNIIAWEDDSLQHNLFCLNCCISAGRIVMRDPIALESVLLAKYFRHGKYSSFQRQLNNFGFRKIEGKGRMAPCVYAHQELHHNPTNVETLLRLSKRRSRNGIRAMQAHESAHRSLNSATTSNDAPFYQYQKWLQGAPTNAVFHQQPMLQHPMAMWNHMSMPYVPPGTTPSYTYQWMAPNQHPLYPFVKASSNNSPCESVYPSTPIDMSACDKVKESSAASVMSDVEPSRVKRALSESTKSPPELLRADKERPLAPREIYRGRVVSTAMPYQMASCTNPPDYCVDLVSSDLREAPRVKRARGESKKSPEADKGRLLAPRGVCRDRIVRTAMPFQMASSTSAPDYYADLGSQQDLFNQRYLQNQQQQYAYHQYLQQQPVSFPRFSQPFTRK